MSDFADQAQKTIDAFPFEESTANELLARAHAVDEADARDGRQGLGNAMGHYLVYLAEAMMPWLEQASDDKGRAALAALKDFRDSVAAADAEELDAFRAEIEQHMGDS